jgi:hypothetical protein
MGNALPSEREAQLWSGDGEATRFFMGGADVQRAVGIDVDFVLAGEYPGDRGPKPVAFLDRAAVAVRGQRVSLLPLSELIELELAAGNSAPHRLEDLADVLEVVRARELPRDLGVALDPFVRGRYDELLQAAQTRDRE